jgi:ribose transport system substrate-binding protein
MTRRAINTCGVAAIALLVGLFGATASVQAGGLPAAYSTLPPDVQALYNGVEDTIQPAAYDGFTMPPKPWKWCHSESYQGNPWRLSVTQELQRLVGLYKDKGWVSNFEMSDSNGDTGQQIAQIRAFIDKKCSIITSFAGSSTALNDVIGAAHKAGIPFVTGAGAVTSPYAINVDSNYVKFGYDVAKGIVDGLGGKGNVLRVEGIAGSPLVAQQRAGADKAFAEAPGIKVIRDVNGNWSPNVTKTVVLQVLATTPQPIDAVWTSGSEARIVDDAFAQAGRPIPLVSGSISGDALGYWKENPDKFKFTGGALMPSWTAQTLFRVGVRVLEGQQPKLNILMIPVPEVKQAELGNWYGSCMTKDAVSVFPVAPEDPMPEALMNNYFVKPAPTALFDYSKTPDPCEAK